ncbi:lipoyl(octanoyl) transferase LipB [Amylibacter sp.]|jgi:lipoyl(octanoyl) transferase|nr:lipoyl(octanoyl) transferase LipB [Amylibacter sp.]MDC1257472.1 lipoyl(octanoyl) transferase LipB [Amylibacter sp.]MDC3304062.1 lipoyl(octanoyl) transferase LipB [Amylibacter sp.]|tara:strand:- start:37 stop:690 length:654 start_codon:yes stop_codon:yes gene_type:complete
MLKWMKTEKFINYPDALEQMEQIVSGLISGNDLEHVWLLEHPELYTAGTSANLSDLIDPDLFPVYSSQRGGQYTYHGPGQRIAYTMLDLNKRGKDVRKYVHSLEEWIIQTLAEFDIKGERRKDRVGVWVVRDDKPPSSSGQFLEDKIAAVGVRLRKWISFHGIAINVNPNLNHYKGIVPCGIQQHGVTSLADLGLKVTIEDLDKALIKTFNNVFEKK